MNKANRSYVKTTLLIPTLNEIHGMRVIMPKIKKEWVDGILIVDGGSTDGTLEYARENGYEVFVQKKGAVITRILKPLLRKLKRF